MSLVSLALLILVPLLVTGEITLDKPACYQHAVQRELYSSLHSAIETGLLDTFTNKTSQRAEILGDGVPLAYNDFYLGDRKRKSLPMSIVEKALPFVDRIYPSNSPTDSKSIKEYGYESLSSTYGYILHRVKRKASDSNTTSARDYLHELIDNPESVVFPDPKVSRLLLYDYYRLQYLNTKAAEEKAVKDSNLIAMMPEYNNVAVDVVAFKSHTASALYKWQAYGDKDQVELHLQLLDVDNSEGNKISGLRSLYKSSRVRSERNVHINVYPFAFKPDKWYRMLKTKLPLSTDELRYKLAVLLTEEALAITMMGEVIGQSHEQLLNRLDQVKNGLTQLHTSANDTLKAITKSESDCYTGTNVSACDAMNSQYTNFRFTLDRMTDHYAQVEYLKSAIYSEPIDIDVIDRRLAKLSTQIRSLEAQIQASDFAEREKELELRTSHVVPTTCSDPEHTRFTFDSKTADSNYDCSNFLPVGSSYWMVPPQVLTRNVWDVRSCEVDDELRSYIVPDAFSSQDKNLYDEFKKEIDNADFNITASLTKVRIERPWFDLHLFTEPNKYDMTSGSPKVSPGPVSPDYQYVQDISTGEYLLPQYISAVVLASNVKIQFPDLDQWDFSDTDQINPITVLMEYAFATKLSGTLGPFNFNLPKSASDSEHNFQLKQGLGGGVELTLPGAQVVGYVMDIVPKFPK